MSTTEMLSTTKVFRTAVALALSTELQIPFVMGPRDSGQESGDLGCIWLEGKSPFGGDGNMEECTYGVRVIPFWMQTQGDQADDRNVDRLEELLERMQAALRAILLTAGHDFFNVGGISIDYANEWVEAALVGYQRNRGAQGG